MDSTGLQLAQKANFDTCAGIIIIIVIFLLCSRAACGKKSHMIPIGGSDSLGLWGYMCAFQEMVDQVSLKTTLLSPFARPSTVLCDCVPFGPLLHCNTFTCTCVVETQVYCIVKLLVVCAW